MILDGLKANLAVGALLVVGGLLTLQTWRLHSEQLAHRDLIAQVESDRADRATAALKFSIDKADAVAQHTAKTQENADEFTITQPTRDAIARADLAVADRLRRNAESRAATYRAMAEAGAAACRDSADRLATLDDLVVRGTGVVARLRADLGRRDAEVILQNGQIATDRAFYETMRAKTARD